MKRKIINNLWIVCTLLVAGFCLSACDSKLDIQQAYEFDVRTMPVPKEIAVGKTVEIRCTLTEKGSFNDNQYSIRFFQFSGSGELRMGKDSEAFLTNDLYPLQDKEFRLYYTSLSDESSHEIEIVVENSFGYEVKMEFQFNSKKSNALLYS